MAYNYEITKAPRLNPDDRLDMPMNVRRWPSGQVVFRGCSRDCAEAFIVRRTRDASYFPGCNCHETQRGFRRARRARTFHATDLTALVRTVSFLRSSDPGSYVRCLCGHSSGKHAPETAPGFPTDRPCSRCKCPAFAVLRSADPFICGCGKPAVDSRRGVPLCADCYAA